MKNVRVNPDILELVTTWLQASPINAALGCFIGYFACWAVSYYLKELI